MMMILSAYKISLMLTWRDLWSFRPSVGHGLKGPLKGLGDALPFIDMQPRVTDFISVSVGRISDVFRDERAAMHVAVA